MVGHTHLESQRERELETNLLHNATSTLPFPIEPSFEWNRQPRFFYSGRRKRKNTTTPNSILISNPKTKLCLYKARYSHFLQ